MLVPVAGAPDSNPEDPGQSTARHDKRRIRGVHWLVRIVPYRKNERTAKEGHYDGTMTTSSWWLIRGRKEDNNRLARPSHRAQRSARRHNMGATNHYHKRHGPETRACDEPRPHHPVSPLTVRED